MHPKLLLVLKIPNYLLQVRNFSCPTRFQVSSLLFLLVVLPEFLVIVTRLCKILGQVFASVLTFCNFPTHIFMILDISCNTSCLLILHNNNTKYDRQTRPHVINGTIIYAHSTARVTYLSGSGKVEHILVRRLVFTVNVLALYATSVTEADLRFPHSSSVVCQGQTCHTATMTWGACC